MHRLTFSQKFGYEPLPKSMRLEVISEGLRAELFNLIHQFTMLKIQGKSCSRIPLFQDQIIRALGKFKELPDRLFQEDINLLLYEYEMILIYGEFNHVLDILQIMVDWELTKMPLVDDELKKALDEGLQPVHDRPNIVDELAETIKTLFEKHEAAYRLDMSTHPYQFAPFSTEEQGNAVTQSIATLHTEGMKGAAKHLRDAIKHLNAQQYSDAVTDSILAVESVARKIDQNASKTLSPALDSLQKAGVLRHPALIEAFKKLYGYTNDEEGIRHALIDKNSADVDVDETTFMYGACACFAAYLTSKQRQRVES